MSLSLYQKKRDFKETPEPKGKAKSSKSSLRFVVQKHDASSLHYDFRLEMEGVLKSWAVPKGPSLNPAEKRLAMMVEDHPYDYRTFEGTIPEGNYGAGTVIVWDEGTYEPELGAGLSKAEQEMLLLNGLAAGNLKIVLHGKKLNGLYALFQLKKDAAGKQWLLVKKSDEFASEEDVTEKDQSVVTGKTIAQVAAAHGTTPNHPEQTKTKKLAAAKPVKKAAPKKAAAKKTADAKSNKKKVQWVEELLGENKALVKHTAMPYGVKPMLATLVDEPFDSKDWLYEIKWDGYRAVAYMNEGTTEIISRNNKAFTEKYYPVTEALQALGINAVLDGEIVAVNEDGLAEFQLLQNWQNSPHTALQYFAFDILWLEGYDVTTLPLTERKRILHGLIPAKDEVLKYSDHVTAKGKKFFEAALKQGLEGIMAKKADSIYELGNRTESWLKIKVSRRQEVIIAGFTQPRNSRTFFGALLLGVYHQGNLVYVGHTGSGFNTKSLEQIYNKLQPLAVKECPFAKCPKGNMPVTWVQPKLVCEIKFTEWTKELIARHPIFMGLREDKKAKEVTIENSRTMSSIVKKASAAGATKTAAKKSATKKAAPQKAVAGKAEKGAQKKSPLKAKTAGLQLNLSESNEQSIVLDKQELKLTSLDKLYWKKEGITKGQMINYYLRIAPYLLPYMLNRPQSLNRYPNGIGAPNFYQKDVRGKVPDWMQKHEDFSESTDTNVEYLVCSNEATLIYMANLGCIAMHPWHSRVGSIDHPDWCLIDLDPDKKNTFEQVIETAQVTKNILDAIGAESCVKTSGSTGIHIYIPLGAKYTYEQSRQLAELVVTMVNQEMPDITSLERNPDKRKGKIYLDFLQNSETQTAAAPYSLRPKPGAPVSTPLHWDEVKKGLTSTTYTMFNIFDRLKVEGDLFAPVLGKGINLEKVLKKVQGLVV